MNPDSDYDKDLSPFIPRPRIQPLAPPPNARYDSPDEALKAINLWAEPRGYAVIKGRSKTRKYGVKKGPTYKV
jgi:hypothetical protein